MFTILKNSELVETEQAKKYGLSAINLAQLSVIKEIEEPFSVSLVKQDPSSRFDDMIARMRSPGIDYALKKHAELVPPERFNESTFTEFQESASRRLCEEYFRQQNSILSTLMKRSQFKDWLEIESPRPVTGSRYNEYYRSCIYDFVYDPWLVGISQWMQTVSDLVDATGREKRAFHQIRANDEKRFPQFAVFYVKLKQLLLNLVQKLTHSKHKIHISDKTDFASLLQNLRSTETRRMNENSAMDKSAISVCPRIFMFTATAYAGRGVYGGNNYAKETREVQHQRQEQARQRALQAPPFNPHQDFFPRTSSGFRRSHKNNQEVFPTNWSNIHAPSTALWLGAAHPGHIAFAVQREVT